MLKSRPLSEQEALLIDRINTTEGVKWDDVYMWQTFRFFDGKQLPRAGGFDDQSARDIAALKRVSFKFALAEAILNIRDQQTQQMTDMLKTMQTAGVLP
jgi:hypothetical protein